MTELQTDEVTILLSRGEPIGIPWESRQALLAEMPPSSMQPTRTAFEEVGTSAPVNLTRDQKRDVITIVERMANEGEQGFDDLPAGLLGLRNALRDDLDTPSG